MPRRRRRAPDLVRLAAVNRELDELVAAGQLTLETFHRLFAAAEEAAGDGGHELLEHAVTIGIEHSFIVA